MKLPLILFLSLLLFACSGPSKNKDNNAGTDSVPGVHADTAIRSKKNTSVAQNVPGDTLITGRFYNVIRFIDSCGYMGDSSRAYPYLEKFKKISSQGHSFYFCPPGINTLYRYFDMTKRDTGIFKRLRTVEKEVFAPVKSIVTYFFISRTPAMNGDKKYFVDGTIEEWKFPDAGKAKAAAVELGRKEFVVFFNVGAFVCYIDNYMYVITSRAAGYMNYFRPIFKKIKKMDAVVTGT